MSITVVLGIAIACVLLLSFVYLTAGGPTPNPKRGETERAGPDEVYEREEVEATEEIDSIDEASAESFPASDPPSSTSFHAGPPLR